MKKLSVYLDEDIADEAALAAKRHGVSLSKWLNAAAERGLIIERGRAAVAEWVAEHGAFTEDELAWADSVLDRARASAQGRP